MPEDTLGILGYRSVPVRQTFVHNTYPTDRFLPRGRVPGSAGTTILNRAQYIDFGCRFQMPGSFVTQSSRQYFVPAGGIRVGCRDTKNSSIEADVLVGRNGVGYFFQMTWSF